MTINSRMEQSNVDLPPISSTFEPATTTAVDDYLDYLDLSGEESNETSGDNEQISNVHTNEVIPYAERFYIWFNFIVMFVIPVLVSLFIQKNKLNC